MLATSSKAFSSLNDCVKLMHQVITGNYKFLPKMFNMIISNQDYCTSGKICEHKTRVVT